MAKEDTKNKETKKSHKINTWGIVSIILGVLLAASIIANIILAIKLPKEVTQDVRRDPSPSYHEIDRPSSRNHKHKALTDREAHKLLESKRQKKAYSWTLNDVDVEACNPDNTICLVEYDQLSKDGVETEDMQVLMQYKEGKWSFDLPGTPEGSVDYYSKYDLIEVKD